VQRFLPVLGSSGATQAFAINSDLLETQIGSQGSHPASKVAGEGGSIESPKQTLEGVV
jgi:hypothetical protein